MAVASTHNVSLIGLGAIGISFAALHLRHSRGIVKVFDTRPDLEAHINSILPAYLDTEDPASTIHQLRTSGRLRICATLAEVCQDTAIIQEQGPENPEFKQKIWQEIEELAAPGTHFWSSTSGIAASVQNTNMKDRSRLLVVHPFNPPHIMPLIEIVPSPHTQPEEVSFASSYFRNLGSGHRPIVIRKELPGFVGNRLAFVLFREAAHLVNEGVISAQDLDTLVEASLGPRWAVQGPFKSYNMGGGVAGLRGFLKNLAGSIQDVWNSAGTIAFEKDRSAGLTGWEAEITKQVEEGYGMPNPDQFVIRDKALKKVLQVQNSM